MPYLTPDSIPEDDDCRPLSIPASSEWLAFFGGALTELTKTYNWQKFGTLTVDETVAKMQSIIDAWYTVGCNVPYTPGGYRVIRINITGNIEMLDENNEWVEPTGDYVIPPPGPRTEPTPGDQMCLAAANAVNVLKTLYESLSDSFNEELTEAEALTAFIAALIAILGFEFAPITWAIAAFFFFLFELLYGALRYLTADLWTEEFSNQIECFLLACASVDAGVVTFDWQCFNDQLNSLANEFSLSEVQLRLYLQLGFMLQFIGGVDGLNLAGATTEIETNDCSVCDDGVCFEISFEGGQPTTIDHVFFGAFDTDHYGQSCTGGVGDDSNFNVGMTIGDVGGCTWQRVEIDITPIGEATDWYIYGLNEHDPATNDLTLIASGTASPGFQTVGSDVADLPYFGVRVICDNPAGCGTGDVNWYAVRICSNNLSNASLVSNCEDCP